MATTLIILIGFTFIIFIHELGHFLAARRVGIKVEVFSIGIGPKLITLFKDDQGTEYILSILPLGGYVKMLGQEDLPQKQTKPNLKPHSFSSKTPRQRLFVVVAGVVMNLLSAYVLITLAYIFGVGFTTNTVGGLEPGAPVAQTDIQVGEEVIALNDRSINSFEDMLTATAFIGDQDLIRIKLQDSEGRTRTVESFAYKNPEIPIAQLGILPYGLATIRNLPSNSSYYTSGLRNGMIIDQVILKTAEQDYVRKTARGILTLINDHPGSQMNVYIRNNESTTAVISNVSIPQTNITTRGFEIASKVNVTPNYPAAKAGLKNGDIITEINNQPIRSFEALQQVMQTQSFTDDLSNIPIRVQRQQNELLLNIIPFYDKGSERVLLGVSPALEENASQLISYVSPEMASQVPGIRVGDKIFELKKDSVAWNAGLIRDNNQISLQYTDVQFEKRTIGQPLPITSGEKIVQYSPITSILKSFGFFYRELEEVYLFIGNLILGSLPVNAIGGPIAIFDTFQTLSAIKGFSYFLLLFAKISISLAIVNMLPIPLLDGGHAAFIGYEMIRRKPAPEEVVRTMNFIGFLILILLMIFVNYNDIMRIINR